MSLMYGRDNASLIFLLSWTEQYTEDFWEDYDKCILKKYLWIFTHVKSRGVAFFKSLIEKFS